MTPVVVVSMRCVCPSGMSDSITTDGESADHMSNIAAQKYPMSRDGSWVCRYRALDVRPAGSLAKESRQRTISQSPRLLSFSVRDPRARTWLWRWDGVESRIMAVLVVRAACLWRGGAVHSNHRPARLTSSS